MRQDGEIRHNLDELNMFFRRLEKYPQECAAFIIERIAREILNDLVLASPVGQSAPGYLGGNLRSNWNLAQAGPLLWEISNNTEYILWVEYGVKGHSLSEDPEKRKKSLRYLFAVGILVEEDGTIRYTYQKKQDSSAGFIRRVIDSWKEKAKVRIKELTIEWIKLQMRK